MTDKDIKLTITAGVDSHMSGYDLVMLTEAKECGNKKIIRIPFKGKGMKKFYDKSDGYMDTRWTKKVNYQQYRKIFPCDQW